METIKKQQKKHSYSTIFLGAVFFVAVYFILTRALHYFILTEESYGTYFWPRVNWVLPHVICGIISILIGPFQFSKKLRTKYVQLHRKSGYVYLSAVFIGAVSGINLGWTSQVNLTYKWGLIFLGIAWLLTSGMALFFILKRKTTQHKEWMVRSYVVTFAFVFFRLAEDGLAYMQIGENVDRITLMSWACWSVPLLFAEVFLQYRKTFKHR